MDPVNAAKEKIDHMAKEHQTTENKPVVFVVNKKLGNQHQDAQIGPTQ